MIDWIRLKPYERDKYRSFEELCYQIAKGLYGHLGRFTSIDDSGGGDGVEFYLTLASGEQWGWQAKFYYPDGSLRVSSRKTSVKRSLQRACEEHPQLAKWFLCMPRNLTPVDQRWFDEKLARTRVSGRPTVPACRNIELCNWGESDFVAWFSEPRFAGKRLFFFGELELGIDWFRSQVERQMAVVRDRFNPLLHTGTSVDARVHGLLGDEFLASQVAGQVEDARALLGEFIEAVGELRSPRLHQLDWLDARTNAIARCQPLQSALENAVAQLENASERLSSQQLDELRQLDWSAVWEQMEQAYDAYQEVEAAFDPSQVRYTGRDEHREWTLREAERMVHDPAWRAASLVDYLRSVFGQLDYTSASELHIFGDAGVGKTHMACHVCDQRLRAGLPALLVLGSQFTGDRPLVEQMRGILDIPPAYSWADFLQALAAAAEAYKTRIPVILDGLDGATCNGVFSPVWCQGLPSLVYDIAQTKDVVLVTTCRTTYQEATWPNGVPENVTYTYGFNAYDAETAVERYFDWYKIRADLTAAPLSQFEHPIYLRIFCETRNPSRAEEKHVYVGEQTLFEVFDEYLTQCNRALCDRLGLHRSTDVVVPALRRMASYLWQQRTRSIPLDELANAVDGQPLGSLNWQSSRTRAVLDEGLLVCRDWRGQREVVFFTHDLLGGYLIADYLLHQAKDDVEGFVQSDETLTALFGDDFQSLHPLHSDISRCLAALLPARTGRHLHDLSDNDRAFSLSIDALFEVAPSEVDQDSVALVTRLFEFSGNRSALLNLAKSTVGNVRHPLNASFWSEQLKALSMPERDVGWTEFVHGNVEHFEKVLSRFELTCQSTEALSATAEGRLHLLAEHIMWVLTSTVRPLRDSTTRALYWYGRRFPEQFLELVLRSLEINDPYVPERMLAATYGVAMARQYDFGDPSFAEVSLPMYGRSLYDAMFRPDAPHATTHILARDYARRTIEISLVHHMDLLTIEEQQRIRPPFMDGGVREWGESEDRNEGEYQDGNAPIHLDFGNYTLGHLVRNRAPYDFRHEGYRLVRANVFWRMYDLGYSLETFGEIDKQIARWRVHYGRASNGRKTDRYGKKYSWIAFYELAGFRRDQDLSCDWPGEYRTSDADIDPSFPSPCQQCNLVQADFLGNRELTVDEWILSGDLPNMTPYLIVGELLGEVGPWVLLDGYINQENLGMNRSRVTFPRSFIVRSGDVSSVAEHLRHQDLGGGWLPEIPEDYGSYAGEIPWCNTYPRNGATELSFVIGARTETESVDKLVLFRDGAPLSADEEEEFWESISDQVPILPWGVRVAMGDTAAGEVIEARLEEAGLEARRICTVPIEREVPSYQSFHVLVPVRCSKWGDYHSTINPGRSVDTPAREIAEGLDLCGQPQTFDLFEKIGKRASVTLCYGEPWHTYQRLTYLRQDLLDHYLADTDSDLVWAIWGERQFHSDDVSGFQAYADRHTPCVVFQDIQVYSSLKQSR